MKKFFFILMINLIPLLVSAACDTSVYSYDGNQLSCILTFEKNKKLPNQLLTVGSYNIYGFRMLESLKNDLIKLPNVSIWALQEVYGETNEVIPAKLLKILPQGQWYIYIKRVNKENQSTWEGQVIASRYPFSKAEFIPLEHSNQRERVALIAHYTSAGGTPFLFINTDHEVTLIGTSFDDRKKQLQSLLNYSSHRNGAAVLITGDMNTTDGDQEILQTENFMAKSFFSRARPDYKDRITFEKLFLSQELDHVFFRNLTSSKRFKYAERKGSDHYPIFVEVRL